jgi:hypothetical protein
MATKPTDVKAIAGWDGWCDPCGTERPLVLTEAGPRGLRAWTRGASWEDRELGLYCRVCGEHQVVPLQEEDDAEVLLAAVPDLLVALTRTGASAVVLTLPSPVAEPTATTSAPAAPVPAPRRSASPTSIALTDGETALDLVAAGFAAA